MRVPISLLALLLAIAPAAAQDPRAAPGQPGWMAAEGSGCLVWNANPQPRETVTWSGACPGGRGAGQGTLVWRWPADGEDQSARYEGEMQDGRPHGRGTYVTEDGDRYEGDWVRGVEHGMGTFTWASGESYFGPWREGGREGVGLERASDGTLFKGEFRADARNGHGMLVYPDGGFHAGAWRDGERNGAGEEVFANGARYQGDYADDRPHGQGTYRPADGGEPFSGRWTEGCFRDSRGRVAAIGRPLAECR